MAIAIVLVACGPRAAVAQAIHLDVHHGTNQEQGLAVAPDGSAWIMSDSGHIVHVPQTGESDFSFNATRDFGRSLELAYGTDGNLWVRNPGGIVRYTTVGVPVPIDSAPAINGARSLTPAADGAMWFVLGDQLGRVSPEGHITLMGGLSAGAQPDSIAFGPDGNVWFTEPGVGSLGRRTSQGQVTEFPMPPGTTFSHGITAGPDGNLYVALDKAIARVTTAGIVTATFDDGQTDLAPSYVATGIDGAIWFTEPTQDRVSRLTLDGKITHYSNGLQKFGRATGLTRGADGTLWLFEFNAETVVRVVIDPPLATTTQAASLGDGRFRLSGLAANRGTPATVFFEYGTTPSYGATTTTQAAPDGDDAAAVSADTGPLAAGTTYHYRIVANGPAGRTAGADQTFTTPSGPVLPGPPDADGDGYPSTIDCNDHSAAIHPGAVDKPGDRIDQDCSGKDAPYPRFSPVIDATWNTRHGRVIFSRLRIDFMPAGARLKLSCHGGGCRLRSYAARVSRSTHRLNLLPRLKKSRLRHNALLELRLSRPGYQTTVTRWTIGPPPKIKVLCQPPGAKQLQRCV